MAPVQSKISFLNLPEKSCSRVIRIMDGINRMNSSLASNSLKTLISSQNPQDASLTIRIGLDITITTSNGEKYTLKFNHKPAPAKDSYCIVHGEADKRSDYWNPVKLRLGDWIAHFREVFNCETISLKFDYGCQNLDFESIKTMLRGLKADELTVVPVHIPYIREALHIFLPVKKLMIEVEQNKLDETDCLNLIKNTSEHLSLMTPTQLDQKCFLGMKMKTACVRANKDSEPVLNEFLKKWMAGGRTTQLKYLVVKVYPEYDEDDENLLKALDDGYMEKILNDIVYEKVNKKRKFEVPGKGFIDISKGYDLVRKDKKRITIYKKEFKSGNIEIHFAFWF